MTTRRSTSGNLRTIIRSVFSRAELRTVAKLTFTPDYNLVKRDPVFEGDYDFEKSYHTFGAVLTSRVSAEVNNKLGISFLQSNETNRWTQLGHSIIERDSLFIRDQMTVAASKNHAFLFGLEYDAHGVQHRF